MFLRDCKASLAAVLRSRFREFPEGLRIIQPQGCILQKPAL